ncbi:hypothetical protein ACQP2X_33955 [Actinoplanes sp. CA-131856]
MTGDVDCGYVARLTITVDPANVEEPGGEGPPPPPPVSAATV